MCTQVFLLGECRNTELFWVEVASPRLLITLPLYLQDFEGVAQNNLN